DSGDAKDLTPHQHDGRLVGGARCVESAAPTPAQIATPAVLRGSIRNETGGSVAIADATLTQDGMTVGSNLAGVVNSVCEFVVFHPNERPYTVNVTSPGQTITRAVQLRAGQTNEITLSLADPGSVSGAVRMFDGTPHVDLPVQLMNSSNIVVATVLSDS